MEANVLIRYPYTVCFENQTRIQYNSNNKTPLAPFRGLKHPFQVPVLRFYSGYVPMKIQKLYKFSLIRIRISSKKTSRKLRCLSCFQTSASSAEKTKDSGRRFQYVKYSGRTPPALVNIRQVRSTFDVLAVPVRFDLQQNLSTVSPHPDRSTIWLLKTAKDTLSFLVIFSKFADRVFSFGLNTGTVLYEQVTHKVLTVYEGGQKWLSSKRKITYAS